MNEPIPKAKKVKRKRYLIRAGIYPLCFFGLVWIGINLLLNLPAPRAYIVSILQKETGVTIHRLGWIWLGWSGNLSLSDIGITTQLQDQAVELDFRSITIHYLTPDRPSLYIQQITTPWGSIQQATVTLLGEWLSPRFAVVVNRAAMDAGALLTPGGADHTQTSSPFNPPVKSLQIENSTVRIPEIARPVRFDLNFSQREDGSAEARITVLSPQQNGSLRNTVTWNRFPLDIASAKGVWDNFPIQPFYPAIHGIVNGSYELTQRGDESFDFITHQKIHALTIDAVTHGLFRSPKIEVQSGGTLDASYRPLSATASIHHDVMEAASSGLRMAPGNLTVHYIQNSTQEQSIRMDILNNRLGRLSLSASGKLLHATPEWNAAFTLDHTRLENWLDDIPQEWMPMDLKLSGSLIVSGTAALQDQTLKQYHTRMQLQDLSIHYPGVSIQQTSLNGTSSGDSARHHVTLQAEPKVFTIEYADPPVSLPLHPFSIQADFQPSSNQYHIQTSPIASDWWNELLITYSSKDQLSASLTASVQQLLQPALAYLAPSVTREIEGTGELSFTLQSDFFDYTLAVQSEDTSFFSFDEEPFIGAQLKAIHATVSLQTGPNSMPFQAVIHAASPFWLYGDLEADFPGGAFSVSIIRPVDDSSYLIEMSLPHKGRMHGTSRSDGSSEWRWEQLDLQQVALPAFYSYMQDEIEALASLQGGTSGWMQIHADSSHPLSGEITFQIKEWRRDEIPAVGIRNAIVTVPFAYPLDVSAFPYGEVVFQAETVLWEDQIYSGVQIAFPLEDHAVHLPQSFSLPFLGGKLSGDRISMVDWKRGYPTLRGDLQLLNIEMEQAGEFIPYLGKEGTLTLHASEVVWEGDRFSLQGSVAWQAFSGTIAVQDVFYQPETRQFGLSMYLLDVDLEQLSRYFHYGKITGQLNGSIRDLLIQFPKGGTDGIPKPIAFDLELKSDRKRGQIISGSTLKKLMELGSTTVPFQEELYSRDFQYSGLGLRGIHNATQTLLYGTLKDNYFIAPSSRWFTDKVGIRMQVPQGAKPTANQAARTYSNIDFNRVWKTLLAQIGTP